MWDAGLLEGGQEGRAGPCRGGASDEETGLGWACSPRVKGCARGHRKGCGGCASLTGSAATDGARNTVGPLGNR